MNVVLLDEVINSVHNRWLTILSQVLQLGRWVIFKYVRNILEHEFTHMELLFYKKVKKFLAMFLLDFYKVI